MEFSPTSSAPGDPATRVPADSSLPMAAVDALLALSDEVARSTRPDELLQRIVATAVELLGLPWSVLMLADPGSRALHLAATHGVAMSELPAVLQLPSETHVNPALADGPPFALDDYAGGPPLSPVWWAPLRRLGVRAILAVPLRAGGTFLGSLHLAGPVPHHFTETEIALLQRLARLAAQLLVHTRTLSATEQWAGALQTMQAVASSLEATLDLDTVLTILVDRSVELAGATGGMLLLWEAAEERLVLRQGVNAPPGEVRVARGQGVSGRAFALGTAQYENDYGAFPGAVAAASEDRVTSVLAVPLLRQGRPFGTITVFSKLFKPFTAQDARVLTLFASQAAVAIDNATLFATVARQRRQLDSIIRALHDGLIVYDRARRVILVNPAAEEILGLRAPIVGIDRAEFTGEPERVMHHRVEQLHDWDSTFAAVLDHGVTLSGVTRVHSDPQRTLQSFYSPYYDDDGSIVGVIAVFRDVSEAQELERLRAELALARQQDDFLSIASHELRTPITAIKGYADLLARRLQPGHPVTARDVQMAGAISVQVRRLVGLVDDLLDVGRIQAGRLDLDLAPCGIRAVIETALATVRPVAGAREPDILVAGDDAPVACDAARLEQVFVNLLTNALKYSAAGPITTTIRADAATVTVRVQDHGVGIPAADLPRVFERFFRAHDVYAHQRGLGLGLYISRQIVERHGGRIWVESSADTGSTFAVALPRAADA